MGKSYKILRITGLHFQNAISHLTPTLQNLCYKEQQCLLFQQAVFHSNTFSKGMGRLGHEVEEIVYDIEEMQKTWAKEHGVFYEKHNWETEILLAQIAHFRPEIILFQDIYSLPFEVRKSLKNRFPFIRLIAIFRGYPRDTPTLCKEFSTADVLLLGSPRLIEKCRKAGLNPFLVYHAFDETLLEKVEQDPRTEKIDLCDFSYLGSSGYGYGTEYLQRYRYLRELLEKTSLRAWLDEPAYEQPPPSFFRKWARNSTKKLFSFLPSSFLLSLQESGRRSQLRDVLEELIINDSIPTQPLQQTFSQKCSPSLFGIEMFQRLYRSKITFNIHAGCARGALDNMRMFQATGMGTCLLTEKGSNLSDLFQENEEVVTYSSIGECREKVDYLLNHEKIRKEIAKKGQEKTLKSHTILKRCEQIDDIFQAFLR